MWTYHLTPCWQLTAGKCNFFVNKTLPLWYAWGLNGMVSSSLHPYHLWNQTCAHGQYNGTSAVAICNRLRVWLEFSFNKENCSTTTRGKKWVGLQLDGTGTLTQHPTGSAVQRPSVPHLQALLLPLPRVWVLNSSFWETSDTNTFHYQLQQMKI